MQSRDITSWGNGLASRAGRLASPAAPAQGVSGPKEVELSAKANFWHFRRGLTLFVAWSLLISGAPAALVNSINIFTGLLTGRSIGAIGWFIFAISLMMPLCGYLILKQPVFYPNYVGGVMGYKNRDAYEKAKLEQSQKRKAAGGQL